MHFSDFSLSVFDNRTTYTGIGAAKDGGGAGAKWRIRFRAKEVAALIQANIKQTNSPVRDFILLCCEYSPQRGKFENLEMDTVPGGAVGMGVAPGVCFIVPVRRKGG